MSAQYARARVATRDRVKRLPFGLHKPGQAFSPELPPLCDGDARAPRARVMFEQSEDRMFDPKEFESLQLAMGRRFTMDGACNDSGDNALVPQNYACPARSFLTAVIAGHFLWLNGPFSQLRKFLEHYLREKARDPYNTSACILTPAWSGAGKPKPGGWRELLKGMTLVKHYPAGSRIFWAVNAATGERELMPGCPFAVDIWYDPPRTRPAPRAVRAVVGGESDETAPLAMMATGQFAGHVVRILFDTGATGQGYISAALIGRLGLSAKVDRTENTAVAAFDGHALDSHGTITQRLKIRGVREEVTLSVVEMDDSFDVILGDGWLSRHACALDYKSGRMTVEAAGKVYSIPAQPRETSEYLPPPPPALASPYERTTSRDIVSAAVARRAIRRGKRVLLLHVRESLKEPELAEQSENVRERAGNDARACGAAQEGAADEGVDAAAGLRPDDPPAMPQILSGASLVDGSQLDALLSEYKDVLRDLPAGLPPERPTVHTIPLVEGARPVHARGYRMSPEEKRIVQEYVDKLVENGWVVPSTSPWSAPILLIPKPDGTMRVCVDYRGLNDVTIKNRASLPRIDDLIDSLAGAKVFSALDLASGYWQLRLDESDASKTGFSTPYGHYEWRVLPMGLSNAPATFQTEMNRLFRNRGLGKYVAVYLDDILVYSRTPEEHLQHVREVLQVLREHEYYCKPSKCQFGRGELKYLGHVISEGSIKPDPAKIEKVANWPVPRTVGHVRSFLGLATYFRRFIQGFAALARPLHRLTQKDVAHRAELPWDATCQASFEALKVALTTAPVLAMPEEHKHYEIWADASVHGVGAVLLQEGRPIYYESRKFSPAEYNYDTGEQEMAAVVHALALFRCYVGTHEFTLVTDHEPLVYFQSKPVLSRKHARWYEFLQSFNFEWQYKEGRCNVADPLSRLPAAGECVSVVHRLLVAAAVTRRGEQPGAQPVRGVRDDPLLAAVRAACARDDWLASPENVRAHGLTEDGGLWWRGQALVIPDADELRMKCLRAVHDSPVGGHFGERKTLELAKRLYWWPTLESDVKHHVSNCTSCRAIKSSNHAPYGELRPHEIPQELWEVVSLDFIVKLPPTERGHDSILVVVDKFSKYVMCKPCSETVDSPGLVRLVEEMVVANHGYPRTVISDRDVRATAGYYQQWCATHGITSKMSFSHHSRANGQAERFNLTLENYLRAFVSTSLDNWDELLPVAQLAINNSYQSSIKTTPFFLNYGRHPWLPGVTYKRAQLTDGQGASARERAREARARERQRWSVERKDALAKAKECLKKAQEQMKQRFDKQRTPREFSEGDRVLLNARNLRFKGPNKCSKLMPRFVGPFTIAEKLSEVAYKLALPDTMRVHPVFHIELLREYKGDGFTPPPVLECEDGTVLWEIERLAKVRGQGRTRQYLVQWKGFGREWDSWEPRKALMLDCPDVVQEFDEQRAQQPGSDSRKRRRMR